MMKDCPEYGSEGAGVLHALQQGSIFDYVCSVGVSGRMGRDVSTAGSFTASIVEK